jgi:hypothetical protein
LSRRSRRRLARGGEPDGASLQSQEPRGARCREGHRLARAIGQTREVGLDRRRQSRRPYRGKRRYLFAQAAGPAIGPEAVPRRGILGIAKRRPRTRLVGVGCGSRELPPGRPGRSARRRSGLRAPEPNDPLSRWRRSFRSCGRFAARLLKRHRRGEHTTAHEPCHNELLRHRCRFGRNVAGHALTDSAGNPRRAKHHGIS